MDWLRQEQEPRRNFSYSKIAVEMTGKQKIFFNMNVIDVIHILLAIYSPVPTCREGEDLIVGAC